MEAPDSPIHVPLPREVLGPRIPHVIHQAKPRALRGPQIPHREAAISRLGNDAHGSQGEPRRRRHRADKPLEDRSRRARPGREMDMDVGYKRRGRV